jgi:hypothetical protein
MFEKLKSWFKAYKAKQEAKKYLNNSSATPVTAKDLATSKKEPYIAVLDTQVNPENIRNGFFELDWNEYFIVQLKQAGYAGVSEEEIVDQWFQDLCRNIGAESGVDMQGRGAGYVSRALREDGKTEIS